MDEWSKEIVKLDPDNAAGLKKKHEFRVQMSEATRLLQTRKFAEARTVLEKALAIPDLSGEQTQTCRFFMAVSYLEPSAIPRAAWRSFRRPSTPPRIPRAVK